MILYLLSLLLSKTHDLVHKIQNGLVHSLRILVVRTMSRIDARPPDPPIAHVFVVIIAAQAMEFGMQPFHPIGRRGLYPRVGLAPSQEDGTVQFLEDVIDVGLWTLSVFGDDSIEY